MHSVCIVCIVGWFREGRSETFLIALKHFKSHFHRMSDVTGVAQKKFRKCGVEGDCEKEPLDRYGSCYEMLERFWPAIKGVFDQCLK